MNFDLQDLTLNRSSIRRYRQKIREIRAQEIRKNFEKIELNALVLHWDGKLLFDLLQRKMVDRLPVVVTNGKIERLLGVPKMEDSKGLTQANAVYEVLVDWGINTSIKAICCDTTASNLGVKKGAAVLLKRLLETKLMFLPCRHHVFELVLRSVFEIKMPGTVGPNVQLFKNFQDSWKSIDQTRYKVGIEDKTVQRQITSEKIEEISSFVLDALQNLQPRDDYKELLQLTLIFLGLVRPENVSFRFPGAFHHARWMAKAIYCLKLFIFQEVFDMTTEELEAVRDTSIFVVVVYIEAWFTCPVASKAPNHDLNFVKKLYEYKSIDEEISTATIKKFKNHLWYLNPESAAMSFFDHTLSLEIKKKMVMNLNPIEEIDDNFPNRIQVNIGDSVSFNEKEIFDFITPQSRNFFLRFDIDDDFSNVDPAFWDQHKSYQRGFDIVKDLRVVNDVAERGVHLFAQYNKLLSRNEDQKQFSILVVNEYSKMFPDAKKETLLKKFQL